MTLVVALQASDGIVLAGDNRGSFGDPRGFMAVNDMRKKVFRLTEHCGIGVSGPPDLASALLNGLERKLVSQNVTSIGDVTLATRECLRSQYNEWFRQFPIEKRPVMSVIVAGYGEGEFDYALGVAKPPLIFSPEVPRIYSLSSEFDYAPMLSDTGFYVLGLPILPVYLINRFYDSSMVKERMAVLAEYIISETASQDPKVGGPITIAIITPYKEYRELGSGEVTAAHLRNEEQRYRLREYFQT